MSPLSRFRLLRREEPSTVAGNPPLQTLHRLPILSQSDVRSSPTPEPDDTSLLQRYTQMAQDLRLSLPPTCHWLDPGDIELVSELPIGAGGFADIYEVTHCGRRAVLKSYRFYISFDVARVVAVCRTTVSAELTANNSLVEVSKRSPRMGPPPQMCGCGTTRRGILNRDAPLRARIRVYGRPRPQAILEERTQRG